MDARTRRRLVGRIITIGALLGAALLIGLGFVPKPVPVATAKVERRTLEVTVDESGRTRIRSKYVISAPVAGQLSRSVLRAGDPVAQGAQVAELAPAAPQLLDERTRAEASARVAVAQANLARTEAQIARARASFEFACDQHERSRSLHAQGGASQQALEQAEFQRRSAEQELAAAELSQRVAGSELAAARAALASVSGEPGSGAKLSLSAPVAGTVLRIFQESEGVVQRGAPLLEIGDLGTLEVVVDVLSTDAVRIAPGAEARIERWGGEYPLEARVRRKDPSAFTTRSALGVEEQRVPVVLDLLEDPARLAALGDGYRVEARIRVAKIEGALAAAASAVFREQGGWVAFAVRDQTARKVALEIGARTPDWLEVKRGLQAGDVVVQYPSDQVEDGVRVARQTASRRESD